MLDHLSLILNLEWGSKYVTVKSPKHFYNLLLHFNGKKGNTSWKIIINSARRLHHLSTVWYFYNKNNNINHMTKCINLILIQYITVE